MVDPDPKPEEKEVTKEEVVTDLSEAERQRQFEIVKSALSRAS